MSGDQDDTGDRISMDIGERHHVPGLGPVVESEFASVSVTLVTSGNGPRLCLTDLRGGRSRLLDALELETIVWLSDGDLRELMDPSSRRWRD